MRSYQAFDQIRLSLPGPLFQTLFILTLFAGSALVGYGEGDTTPTPSLKPTLTPTPVKHIQQLVVKPTPVFSPGEYLVYQVSWLGVKAGSSYMSVDHPEKLNDNVVWPLRTGAETTGLVKKLYRIDNKTVSYYSPDHDHPLRFEVEQFSGGREEFISMFFYQDERRVEWRRMYKNRESKGSDDVPPGVQDTLSSIYYLRNQELKVGAAITIPIYVSQKNWLLQAKVVKKEKITVPAGTFRTLYVKPIMLPESEGEPKGTMELWFTDDERRIPVQVSSEVPVGSVLMKLVSIEQGKPL